MAGRLSLWQLSNLFKRCHLTQGRNHCVLVEIQENNKPINMSEERRVASSDTLKAAICYNNTYYTATKDLRCCLC